MSQSLLSDPRFWLNLDSIKRSIFLDLAEYTEYISRFTINLGTLQKMELPTFKVVCSPDSPRWAERVEEELKIFEIFRDLEIHTVGFAAFDGLKQVSQRKFSCLYLDAAGGKSRVFEILLARDYPKSIPVSKFTDGVCLGSLAKVWKRKKHGLAHYLAYIVAPIISFTN
ncbi:MAG: hypothetical protein KIH08_11835 [Candidatus Freyarchaeota archaeon]|nr:hypothetical protein [Candidatus Jordarchaeia archaeon]MBS7269322.1 hypothetical protein [Candidatus Jordarchaeia archaeon]MBS7281128.1 hypothetical protein [Candidatus Jordarchaeia archaeon]